jgi:hypothetical protein
MRAAATSPRVHHAQKDSRASAKLWVEPVAVGDPAAPAAPRAATSTPARRPPRAWAPPRWRSAVRRHTEAGGQRRPPRPSSPRATSSTRRRAPAPTPTFAAAKASYLKVVDLAPNSSAAVRARGLEKIGLHEEIARIKADKASLEVDRRALAPRREATCARRASNDPLWGRFQSRGWLEKQGEQWVALGRQDHERGGLLSGRYDLALYQGFQLGITGALQRGASSEGPARFDVRRIEVLDGRGTTKR